jgi:hypothetical protein
MAVGALFTAVIGSARGRLGSPTVTGAPIASTQCGRRRSSLSRRAVLRPRGFALASSSWPRAPEQCAWSGFTRSITTDFGSSPGETAKSSTAQSEGQRSHLSFPPRRTGDRRVALHSCIIDGEAIITDATGLAVFSLVRLTNRSINGSAVTLSMLPDPVGVVRPPVERLVALLSFSPVEARRLCPTFPCLPLID